MGRVGTSIAEQSSSSLFTFADGPGEIVEAFVENAHPESFENAVCRAKVGIQRLDKAGKHTNDEVVYEELGIGNLDKFHAGNAADSDAEGEDLGDTLDVQGNCIYAVGSKGPDRQSKFSKFSASLEGEGFPSQLLNGFMPNLIGVRAEFFQQPQPKGANYKGKNDPMCIQVVKGTLQMPSGTGKSKPASKSAAASSKANGAVPAPAAVASSSTGAGDADSVGVDLLTAIGAAKKGQTVTLAQLSPLIPVTAAKLKKAAMIKPVQALIKQEGWLIEKAAELGWDLSESDEGKFGIPA